MVELTFDRTETAKGIQYLWHGPLKNWPVFLSGEVQQNYVAEQDLCSVVPGFLFPTAGVKKADLYSSDYVFCHKAISIDILCLIQKIILNIAY